MGEIVISGSAVSMDGRPGSRTEPQMGTVTTAREITYSDKVVGRADSSPVRRRPRSAVRPAGR
jgi:hypothetical protein